MKIILNNTEIEFNENELTIRDIMKIKNYTFKMLVIKVNGTLIKKENYDSYIVKNNDKVDIIHLISGG